MQQLMFEQDEETVELKETYSTLQQEVELKTKKLKKVMLAFSLVTTVNRYLGNYKNIFNRDEKKYSNMETIMTRYTGFMKS